MEASAIIYGAVMAAGAIYSGISGSNTARANARESAWNASYNANLTLDTAYSNRDSLLNSTGANNSLDMFANMSDNQFIQMRTAYNAGVTRNMADYNAHLLEDEAANVYDSLGLDLFQFDEMMNDLKGKTRLGYAAAGVRLDSPGDTPELDLLDLSVEGELDKLIMRRNADTQAKYFLDQAAKGQYEANQAVNQMIFEGGIQQAQNNTQTALSIVGRTASAAGQARSIVYDAQSRSQSLLATGGFQSSQYRRQGQQALVSGFINGATTYYGAQAKAG